VREAYQAIHGRGADIAGLVISLDRQERGRGTLSAVQELESSLNIPVISIVRLDDLVMALEDSAEYSQHLEAVLAYRRQYGVLS
jgi:orotate phosphoribosyltransferase